MNRTLNVVRMQLVNKYTYVWVPLIILGGSFALSLVIFALIPVDAPKYSGAAQAPLWYFLALGIQALTLSFPFSQAMSVTRRQFYLGTLLTAVAVSFSLAVIFVIGGMLEGATDGWGMNGVYFRFPWVWEAGPFVAGLAYFVIAMFFFVMGFWAATIYKRYGTLGVTLALLGVGILLVGTIWVITVTDAWPTVGPGLVNLGPLGLAAAGIVLVAVLATASFTTLRRAIP